MAIKDLLNVLRVEIDKAPSSVIICGGRDWGQGLSAEYQLTLELLVSICAKAHIIHGGCRGADMMADDIVRQLGGKDPIVYAADWIRYGRPAGPIRNKRMIKDNPVAVIAFHNNLMHSKGTRNMLGLAISAKTPLIARLSVRAVSRLDRVDYITSSDLMTSKEDLIGLIQRDMIL